MGLLTFLDVMFQLHGVVFSGIETKQAGRLEADTTKTDNLSVNR